MVNRTIIFLGQEYVNESEMAKVAIVQGVSLLLSDLIIEYGKKEPLPEGQISVNCDVPPETAIQVRNLGSDFKARIEMAFGIAKS